jgi:protein-S-isoprenylcysteine O-methyltransferase Ste14
MAWAPDLGIGWLNGWIFLVFLVLTEGLVFPTLAIARAFGHLGILAEEQVCLEQYGEAYRAYMDRVSRYLILF